jgi:hypothetical protein
MKKIKNTLWIVAILIWTAVDILYILSLGG